MKNLRNQSGAFDMPSIIIGVIVVGILTAGVLATVFGVVPWAQDKGAKQDLSAVTLAQESVRALSAADGPGVYLNKADLVARGGISDSPNFKTSAGNNGACYTATTRSASGKVFWADSDDTPPKEYVSGAQSSCTKLNILAGDIGTVMASTWKVTAGQELTLPLGGAVNVTIDWGDGVVETVTNDGPSHKFPADNNEQTITIDGNFNHWGGWGWGDAKSLLSVDEWGETGTTDLFGAFWDADSLRHVESVPATTETLEYAFTAVGSNFTIGDFDTENVTNMEGMFDSATAFNQPLNFDTQNVTDMDYMLSGAAAFNQTVNFDTSNVTAMNSMFNRATAFNQPLSFITKNVTDMAGMFSGAAAFNQPMNFDTQNVTRMGAVFYHASAFNQDLSQWNVLKVTSTTDYDTGADSWSSAFKPKF